MIRNRNRSALADAAPPNFWTAYSDLLAGMLLVFVLLLVVALFHYAAFNRQKEELLETQESRLLSFHELQLQLVERLQGAFVGEDIQVDPNSGVIRIDAGILFGEGEAILRPQGRQRLTEMFDAYFSVILSSEFNTFIDLVEIEGHTNSNGTYLNNLELSQQRALVVMRALLAHAGADRERLQRIVVAGGRSFSHLILDENGQEDAVRSRRIEIKFRLKERELFQGIYQDLTR